MPGESDRFNKFSTWELWRQDDNGAGVLVAEYAEQNFALKALAQ
ncbi:hypothetical protein [Desulforhabdus amnigena]|jgi:hypothetical protein|uniref:Uncharacterized protein n=1 Tax=Desulforhabdus amnigena TaxID=40218 RepID=A0A9W6L9C5_9BACT|nr:hypothetical protein [Desulforhabdus amnigena]GLI35011.1 hypothetical protein DAMNIGENAA_24440 [Desulforhabdus amnigena]